MWLSSPAETAASPIMPPPSATPAAPAATGTMPASAIAAWKQRYSVRGAMPYRDANGARRNGWPGPSYRSRPHVPKTKTPPAAGRPPGFTGFGAGLIPFFAELAENQSRDWFLANRPRYDRDVHVPLESLVTSLSLALAARDIPLHGSPKASIFRINRDVRFSRDKTPYKTHASAVLTRTGDKHSQGLLYVHAGLGRSFMAAGFHALEPDQLAAMRDAMRARPVAWREIVADWRAPAWSCPATPWPRACRAATTPPNSAISRNGSASDPSS